MNAKRNYSGFSDLLRPETQIESQSIDVRITAADYPDNWLAYAIEAPKEYEFYRHRRENS